MKMPYFFIVLLAIFLAGLGKMLKEAFSNKVVKQEVLFKNFPDTFGRLAIFFISDIHRRNVSEKVINEVSGHVDLVIIGGDLMEKGVPIRRVRNNLTKLRSLGPVYFVWGNNDDEDGDQQLERLFQECQVKALDNTAVIFESEKGEKISLLGVDDLSRNRDRLDLALLAAEQDSFKILACHYPQIIDKILPENEISLVLSGHTHGGQIHILGYSPFKRGAITKRHHTTILISNGYGTTSVPLRLGAPAECHFLVLKKETTLPDQVDNSPTNVDNID